ncbi:MAG: hypothetical protein ABIJ86_11370, partial [Spirochaetota bacterium]
MNNGKTQGLNNSKTEGIPHSPVERPARQGVSLNVRSMLLAALLLFIVNDTILLGFLSISLKTYAVVNQGRNIIGKIQALETNELHYRISGNRSYAVTNAETIEQAIRALGDMGNASAGIVHTDNFAILSETIGRYSTLFTEYMVLRDQAEALRSGLQKNTNDLDEAIAFLPEAGQTPTGLQARLAIQVARLLEAQVHEGRNSASRDSALLWEANTSARQAVRLLAEAETTADSIEARTAAYRSRLEAIEYAANILKLEATLRPRERLDDELHLVLLALERTGSELAREVEGFIKQRYLAVIISAIGI